MSWKDVPMPRQIRRLPRDVRGFPVPYVAETEEEQDSWTFQRDKHGVLYLTTVKPRARTRTPLLGEMNADRQRHAMSIPCCQVCAKDLRGDWRKEGVWLTTDLHMLEEGAWLTEPPCCWSCLAYALRVCPGIVSKRRKEAKQGEDRRVVLRVRDWELRGRFLLPQEVKAGGKSAKEANLPLEEAAYMPVACSFYVVRPTDYDVHPTEQWLRARGVSV